MLLQAVVKMEMRDFLPWLKPAKCQWKGDGEAEKGVRLTNESIEYTVYYFSPKRYETVFQKREIATSFSDFPTSLWLAVCGWAAYTNKATIIVRNKAGLALPIDEGQFFRWRLEKLSQHPQD